MFRFFFFSALCQPDISFDVPIAIEIVVVFAERIHQAFCDFRPSHEEEKLTNGVNGEVEWFHLISVFVDVVALDPDFGDVLIGEEDGEEVDVDGESDDLRVDERNVDPVVCLNDALVLPEVVQRLSQGGILSFGKVIKELWHYHER